MQIGKIAATIGLGFGSLGVGCSHLAHPGTEHQMNITPVQSTSFGTAADGKPVEIYTLTNSNGLTARIMTYGATLTEMHVPDKQGAMGDVVLGFDDLKQYEAGKAYFGATVGRYANRIGGAKFSLDGKEYKLFANNGPNSLHGGKKGFDKVVWKGAPEPNLAGPAVRFSYVSADGEEGYPGNLSVTVVYTLTNQNELKIDYTANTDQDTVLNLTNHSYWNLSAGKSPTILDEVMMIVADRYTPFDKEQIPTGKIDRVEGTPLDFRRPTVIGAHINEAPGGPPTGYDHNYVLNNDGQLALAARASDPQSGRVLEVFTTQPGLQFYTGNFLDGKVAGKGGVMYPQHGAFCLETQHYPDSPNHANFPTTTLHSGETFHQVTVYRFEAK